MVIDITPGPNKCDLFSFLFPTLRELLILERGGLDVTLLSGAAEHFKVKLCACIGDIPGIAELSYHTGHTSYYGCRICTIKGTKKEKDNPSITFPPSKAMELSCKVRQVEDYIEAGVVCIFTKYFFNTSQNSTNKHYGSVIFIELIICFY